MPADLKFGYDLVSPSLKTTERPFRNYLSGFLQSESRGRHRWAGNPACESACLTVSQALPPALTCFRDSGKS
jgi:hypothetical protein